MSKKKSTTDYDQQPPERGSEGFSLNYWHANYDEPEEMDGIINASQHAHYLKAFFDVDFVDINSVIDFGFGLGHIFEKVLTEFQPYRAWGIEPSVHAFKEAKEKRNLKPVETTKLTLKQWSLQRWAKELRASKKKHKWFDLGLCTSVFQYLTEDEIDEVLPMMSRMVKYLYFSVPTDHELERQVSDLSFKDEYALRRPKEFYREKLFPHFTIVGARILESKHHFSEDNTFFTDYLFRD